MNRNTKITAYAALVVLIVLVSAVALHGNLLHTILAELAAIVFILIAFFALLRRRLTRRSIIVLGLAACIVVSRLVGGQYHEHNIRATEDGLSALIDHVRSVKAVVGKYPTTVEMALYEKSIPSVFRGGVTYEGYDDRFDLYFSDMNSGIEERYYYDSSAKDWELRVSSR